MDTFKGMFKRGPYSNPRVDGASSSGSPQDSEAKLLKKEVVQQEVNGSLVRVGDHTSIPTLQVLFFHGLPLKDFSNVHLDTWDNGEGILWPQAWLVETFPGAQIFFVKYSLMVDNPEVHMNNIGENLMSDMIAAKVGQVGGCPVVLVGHCIGGLIIKEVCLQFEQELNSRLKEAKKAFLESMRGIFYYSTPHNGIEDISRVSHFCPLPLFKYCEVMSRDRTLLNYNFDKLCKKYPKWKIEGVGEDSRVNSGPFRNILVVGEASARVGINNFSTLPADHFSITKPQTKSSSGFIRLERFLDNIAKEEMKSRDCNVQFLPESIVGIQMSLDIVKNILRDVSKLVLTGMGGLGKTTLAKAIFNELRCKFEYTCFVPDVKSISGTEEKLKIKVLRRVRCNGKKVAGDMNWSELKGKRLLLILDDISDMHHINVLSEIARACSGESRFIATSRRKDLLDQIYEVPFLDEKSATQLFMGFASQDKTLPSQLESLGEKIVLKCAGLPLPLEILGKRLKRTDNEEDWKQILTALDKAELISDLDERLWAKLKPSIDGLQQNERQIFLDATTFFHHNRWTLREAQAAWREVYGETERLLWRTLVDRSLVYDVKEDSMIRAHEQLISLGRKIASETCNGRVVKVSTALRLLRGSEVERKNIQALRLTEDGLDDEDNNALQSMSTRPSIMGNRRVCIGSLALEKLEKLRYLEVVDGIVYGGEADCNWFPSSLVALRCVGFKPRSWTRLPHLVVLKISYGRFDYLGQLPALRILVLVGIVNEAHEIMELFTPIPEEVGDLSKLEILMFRTNIFLETLPHRFGELSNLKILMFSGCPRLRALPESFGLLSSLEHLQLSECRSLTLPESFGALSRLKCLEFYDCGLLTLPESFGELSSLNFLRMEDCNKLESLPESFGRLPALTDLNILNCHKLKSLGETFGPMTALSRLTIVACTRLQCLPESLGELPVLSHLELRAIRDLHSLPKCLGQLAMLEYLEITNIKKLDALPDSLADLVSLSHLVISHLWSLKGIPDYIQALPALQTLELSVLPHVKGVPSWLRQTGARHFALSRSVFRMVDRHFSLTQHETAIDPLHLVRRIHGIALDEVKKTDYKRALEMLEILSFETPKVDGFLLQEKGIIRRMMKDLDGALGDLTAALECFSKGDDGHHYKYDCWKHRGYVKFLLGDEEGAKRDSGMALELLPEDRRSVFSDGKHQSLGGQIVRYLDVQLEGTVGFHNVDELFREPPSFDKVMVNSFDFPSL